MESGGELPNRQFNRWIELATHYYGIIDRELAALIVATAVSGPTPGDPIWLMIVGPPSSMKSEHLYLFAPEPYSVDVTTMTKFAMVPRDGKGVLEDCKDRCMLISDFSAILSMNPVELKEIFGYLRRAFDGRVTKIFAGKKVTVEGKFSLLGACTEELEKHRATMSSLGERFIYVRATAPDVHKVHWLTPTELKIAREDVSEKIGPLIRKLQDMVGLIQIREDKKVIEDMHLIAMARTALHRNYRTGSIELTPQPEGIMRMYSQTEKLKAILRRIDTESAIIRVYQGCIPLLRAKFMEHASDNCNMDKVALTMKIGKSTLKMVKQDLSYLGFLKPKGPVIFTDEGYGLKQLLGFSGG